MAVGGCPASEDEASGASSGTQPRGRGDAAGSDARGAATAAITERTETIPQTHSVLSSSMTSRSGHTRPSVGGVRRRSGACGACHQKVIGRSAAAVERDRPERARQAGPAPALQGEGS